MNVDRHLCTNLTYFSTKTQEVFLCKSFELLHLKFQDVLPKEDLLNALYLEFINRVNEVGVDVNKAVTNPHTAALVQFISGLGPRKGGALLKVSQNTI